MEQETIIKISAAIPRMERLRFEEAINWQIKNGERWAIVGANGSGKTLLADILSGKYALKSGEIFCKNSKGEDLPVSSVVKSVAFRDIYSIVDSRNSYYQQRWNRGDKQEIPLVKELLPKAGPGWLNILPDQFGMSELMDKEVNLLSSGELRKFLVVRSLLSGPRILVLDNPFIGLDISSRAVLNDLLARLAGLNNLQIVLILSSPQDIPRIVTNVLPVSNKRILPALSRREFLDNEDLINSLFAQTGNITIPPLKSDNNKPEYPFEYAADLKNIHVVYGKRTILKGLNWQVKRGEKWALLGANGSGKSTLLSLVCGDNPQAYANDIILFDRKRGTGESIWDIKKRIGYISPEMHLYYLKNVRCLDVVGSGFFDTIGLYRKCNTEQEKAALEWMNAFNIGRLKDVSFLDVSSGEQRLVLLARVFVKNPDLLILDEPLHGLDITNKKRVKKLIERFCGADKTLIYVTHYENEIPDIVNKRLVLGSV
ncbi:MAG: ATP-binding cassette domain-containing protein [Prevotella sp.]|nr:ATP-binding cassette domain-containing protein [Prevotella sp.]